MYTNFLLGELKVTDAARIRLGRTPLDLIARHAVNDHGRITPREIKANRIAMKTVGPILSRFMIDPTDLSAGFVEVVTDELWETTTVKLQDE